MIDWLTLIIDSSFLSQDSRDKLEQNLSKITKINPDGILEWCAYERKSVRSDSHQTTISYGQTLMIYGSPARVMSEHNVFGSSDIVECFFSMIGFVSEHCDVILPTDIHKWRVSRIDFNHNYYLESRNDAIQSLSYLRQIDSGRYSTRSDSDTLYIGKKRSRRSAKIYLKGAHLHYLLSKGEILISQEELELCESLLRFELKLNSIHIKENYLHWSHITEDKLEEEYLNYFEPMIGTLEVFDMKDNILQLFIDNFKTERKARSLYNHWLSIKQIGFENWKLSVPKATYHRIIKDLKSTGLSYADFHSSENVIPIRRKPIVLSSPVNSFDEIRALVYKK